MEQTATLVVEPVVALIDIFKVATESHPAALAVVKVYDPAAL